MLKNGIEIDRAKDGRDQKVDGRIFFVYTALNLAMSRVIWATDSFAVVYRPVFLPNIHLGITQPCFGLITCYPHSCIHM